MEVSWCEKVKASLGTLFSLSGELHSGLSDCKKEKCYCYNVGDADVETWRMDFI